MNRSILLVIASSLLLSLLLSACGGSATPTPSITIADTPLPAPTLTSTADACAPENIKPDVDRVHRHMREFDDASTLAASMPREQLSGSIATLQRIRREAEDESVPPCLATLKDHQIRHMNSVISTLLAFLSMADPQALDCSRADRSADEEVICQNIVNARQQHDLYTVELARLLGIPIITATAGPSLAPSETLTPAP